MSIKELLKEKENRYLLSDILKMSYEELLIHEERELSKAEYNKFLAFRKKLDEGMPLPYILGYTYFLNRKFFVNQNTLIPRPETEELVLYTRDILNFLNIEPKSIIDLGTGSGVIAISLKSFFKDAKVFGIDISNKALEVARINLGEVVFKNQDMLKSDFNKYDLIISNPPYIKEDSKFVSSEVVEFEPHLALFGGEDGLKYILEIIDDFLKNVNDRFLVALEIGIYQAEHLGDYLKSKGLIFKFIKDLNGIERFLFISSENKLLDFDC